jgi:hypothetical protein
MGDCFPDSIRRLKAASWWMMAQEAIAHGLGKNEGAAQRGIPPVLSKPAIGSCVRLATKGD